MTIRRSLTAAVLLSALVPATTAVAPTWAGAATPPKCTPGHITLRVGPANGAAGTSYHPIIFTNTGATCVIEGVPALQPGKMSGGTFVAVGPAAKNLSIGEMPALHTLTKGQSVSVAFGVTETGNYTPSVCKAASASVVSVVLGSYAKGDVTFKPALSVCTKLASTRTQLIAAGTQG